MSEPINTGGPAFPTEAVSVYDTSRYQGMTLRDYFAAKAMQGILAGDHPITHGHNPLDVVAEVAYEQADAMIKARGL